VRNALQHQAAEIPVTSWHITAGQNSCRSMGQHHRMQTKPQNHTE